MWAGTKAVKTVFLIYFCVSPTCLLEDFKSTDGRERTAAEHASKNDTNRLVSCSTDDVGCLIFVKDNEQ